MDLGICLMATDELLVWLRFTLLITCLCLCSNGFLYSFIIFWWDDSVEYSISYGYLAMFAYFDRDNIALEGFAK